MAFLVPEAVKAQQWEVTKGHLRALVALQGSHQSEPEQRDRWLKLELRVEDFIRGVEDEALQE